MREMITYNEKLQDEDVRKAVEQQMQANLRKKVTSTVKSQVVKTNKSISFIVYQDFFRSISYHFNYCYA